MDTAKTKKYFQTTQLKSLQLNSTSKGNQSKWYDLEGKFFIKKQFEYQDKLWRDDLVEIIASEIGKQMPLRPYHITILEQKPCIIKENDKQYHGVYSKNFIEEFGKFISFQRLLECNNMHFPEEGSIGQKWEFILEFFHKKCNLDVEDYLIIMVLIDYLVGNEDRHLNNFGCTLKKNDNFHLAPLFDFGLGLFEHDRRYEGVPFRSCLSLMESKPFAADNQKIIDYLSKHYPIKKYVPEKLDLSQCEIPSPKAGSYLLNRCSLLNIELNGVV